MNYLFFYENIKKTFSKEELKSLELVKGFDELKLANSGDNDAEGYQVFTPAFIVKDMVKAIGEENVFDLTKTILEPTSGDGAFTTYILLERLNKDFKEDRDTFEINALKSLSTIYSVEMDKDLLIKQRNNILTCFTKFSSEHKIQYSEGFIDVVKCIIVKNFIWAMFNSENPIMSIWGTEVIYKMPQAVKKNYIASEFPVWEISKDAIAYHMEGVSIGA